MASRYSILLLLSLFLFQSCGSPHRYVLNEPVEPLEIVWIPEKIRIALVLGSGGVRGMAHVGVLEEFEAEGIKVDLIVGCSAGSIVGALYADNPDITAIKAAVWKIRARSFFDFDIWNCRFGLSQDLCMRKVLNECLNAKTFDQLQIPLIVVTSDLYSGELVPIGHGELVPAIQASCSIPFVFVPCKHMGRVLVDGGVINPVPVKVAKDLGAEIIIAVDLSELLPKTYPTNLFQVATRSAEIAMMWQNEWCTRNADVVIRPKTCEVGVFNEKFKWELYEAGKLAAKEQMPLIKEILAARYQEEKRNSWKGVYLNCYTPQIYHEED